MKKIILIVICLFISNNLLSQSKTHVKGYTKKNGTYVAPHNRTQKNHTQKDNWSSKPNRNPDTGKKGHKQAKR